MMLRSLKKALKAAIPPRHHLMMDVAWSRLTWPLHLGEGVVCPICGGRFRRFLPHYDKRAGARCPRCRSYERHRLLWLYLRRQTDLFRGRHQRVLHMAPEFILQSRIRRFPQLQYVSGDLESPIAMLHFDITDIPFRADWFDVVLCSHVLEHIPDDRAAMSELCRVLRPGGWAIMQVPMADADTTDEDPDLDDPRERERRFGQHDHVRMYGRDFVDRLRAAGFTVRADDFARRLPEAAARKYGLIRHEEIYYCTKPTSAAETPRTA